jgi:hypothetical protein
MMSQESQKGRSRRGEPLKTLDFAIEQAVSYGNKASIPPPHLRGLPRVPGPFDYLRANLRGTPFSKKG